MREPVAGSNHRGSNQGTFKTLPVVVTVLAVSVLLSMGAGWYGEQVSVPRYCANQVQTRVQLERILTRKRPAGDASRKPYVLAARLLFLLPQGSDEPVPAYLRRVEQHLQEHCQ